MDKVSNVQEVGAQQRMLKAARRLMAEKGFSAVGLTELLKVAGVPKGSFYHYYASKEAFGESLLEDYFEAYLLELERLLLQVDLPMWSRLLNFWERWEQRQMSDDPVVQCLAVKLAAEVADLSEAMREVLKQGTGRIISRLAIALEEASTDGPALSPEEARAFAQSQYQLWFGASVLSKITQSSQPFSDAMFTTRLMLTSSHSQSPASHQTLPPMHR